MVLFIVNPLLRNQLKKYINDEQLQDCSCILLNIFDKYILVQQLVRKNSLSSLYSYYHPQLDNFGPNTHVYLSNDHFIRDCQRYYDINIITLCVIYENMIVKRSTSIVRDMIDNNYIPLPFSHNSQAIIQNMNYTDYVPFPLNAGVSCVKISSSGYIVDGSTLVALVK